MRIIPLLPICIAFVVADNDVHVSHIRKEVTIDAAFRYGRDLHLISGSEYLAIAPDGLERYVKARTGNTDVPVTWPIQAAVHWPLKSTVYYFGKAISIRANQTSMTSKVRSYGKYRNFLKNGGPDAAAFRAGWFYIFKGCQYVKQVATLWYLGDAENIVDIDDSLPCDIDAAWTSSDRRSMTLLKGNQIWKWGEDGVSGPVPFESEYTIWSWKLKSASDGMFDL